jgi:hypothetical protein
MSTTAFAAQFKKARRRAVTQGILSGLTHSCNELIPSSRVFSILGKQNSRSSRLNEVPIKRIVGSSGRTNDFDLSFQPHNNELENRWTQIAAAKSEGVDLPPVLLIKVGDAYLIEDGHHRVSVARDLGEESIKARVIDLDSSRVVTNPNCARLGFEV